MTKKKKNILIAAAMMMVLAIGSIAAYFTATDTATNQFTIGNVSIEQTEPSFPDDPEDQPKDVTPNSEWAKDPQVTNTSTSDNDSFIYTLVAIPKKVCKVVKTDGTGPAAGNDNPGIDGDEQMTQLFQLNAARDTATTMAAGNMLASLAGQTGYGVTADAAHKITAGMVTESANDDQLPVTGKASDANKWTGVDTWNANWYLLDVNGKAGNSAVLAPYLNDYNIYLFAYGNGSAMTRLARGETTPALFNSVTVANVVNVNDLLGTSDENNIDYDSGLEGTVPQMLVKSFAIQADNLSDNSTPDTTPAGVWTILNNQDGAYRALADELKNFHDTWQTVTVYSGDGTVN